MRFLSLLHIDYILLTHKMGQQEAASIFWQRLQLTGPLGGHHAAATAALQGSSRPSKTSLSRHQQSKAAATSGLGSFCLPGILSAGTEIRMFQGLNISVGRKGAWAANPSLCPLSSSQGSGHLPGASFCDGKCCAWIIVAWVDAGRQGEKLLVSFYCSCLPACPRLSILAA